MRKAIVQRNTVDIANMLVRRQEAGVGNSHAGLSASITYTQNMKIPLLLIVLALLALLFIGYYEEVEDAETHTVYFIKTLPTFQVRFRHLFASDADDKPLAQLTEQERDTVIDYCKYRLGIETQLKTQEELAVCKQR